MLERSAVHDVERGPYSPSVGSHPSLLSLDRLLDVLAADLRRRVVQHLADRDESMSLDSLVTAIAAARTPGSESTGSANRESTRLALCHSHLPKLADSDVIEFDPDSGIVSPGPQLHTASGTLDAVESVRTH